MKKFVCIFLCLLMMPLFVLAQWSELKDPFADKVAVEKPKPVTQSEYQKLLQRANRGDAKAQYEVGNKYYYGDKANKIKEDKKKAIEWYTKSAIQGYAAAQNDLGICYYNGEGVDQDYKKAVEWFTKSANQGNADAQDNLGVCYYHGNGVEQDYNIAVEWYTKSADQGNARAQYHLVVCYSLGTDKDYKKAVEWYIKSANQGYAWGQYNLGYCYEKGKGVDKNMTEAIKWYTKAAEQGNADAKKALERIKAAEVSNEKVQIKK